MRCNVSCQIKIWSRCKNAKQICSASINPLHMHVYSGDLKSDHSKSRNILNSDFWRWDFKRSGFSYGCRAMAKAIVQTIQKPDHLKSGLFCPDFKWFFDKMVPICPYFKWLGFYILDPIPITDHLQPNLLSTIHILCWERLNRKGDVPERYYMKFTVNLMAWKNDLRSMNSMYYISDPQLYTQPYIFYLFVSTKCPYIQ